MSKNEQQKRGGFVPIGDLVQRPATHLTHLTRTGVKMLVVALPILGYCITRVSDATMADVLLAGMVLLSFGARRRWGRFRGEKNFNKRSWFSRILRFFKGF